MPKVTEAHVEARRQQILDAARACFSRNGFHQTTMHDICQEAELSPGAVYRYFPSKEDIIEAMAEESRRRNIALIEESNKLGDTLQVLDELARAFFAPLDDPECVPFTRLDVELWAEALRDPKVHASCQRSCDSVRQLFTEFIRRVQERGDINPELNPDAIARIMISLYHGMLLQKVLFPDTEVWNYVAAAKAMMTGTFWQGQRPDVDAGTGQSGKAKIQV